MNILKTTMIICPILLTGLAFVTSSSTQNVNLKTEKLQEVLDKTVDGKKIFGTSYAIRHKGETWMGSAGNLTTEQPYFIASTTKLFTTALVLNFCAQGKLQLDDPISRYLEPSVMQGLHIYKGKDYSNAITIRHLLAHTSGLPDYFQDKRDNGRSLEDDIVNGRDQYWTFAQAIEWTKAMKPLFAPGTKGKAKYSDTNFQLLGKIIERVSHKSYIENCDMWIIKPLNLNNTYLYQDTSDRRPQPLHYKKEILNIPKAMASFGCDGGMVSNNTDMLVFIEAFFDGQLFPKQYINILQNWEKIFFPMQSGVGIHRFKLPWYFDPTGSVPELMGHSGLSGALAYYSPAHELYIVGTVNQVHYADQSFKTAIRLIRKVVQ